MISAQFKEVFASVLCRLFYLRSVYLRLSAVITGNLCAHDKHIVAGEGGGSVRDWHLH